MMTSYTQFLSLMVRELSLPKLHLAVHMYKRISHFGNPRQYATWRDEGLNKVLKQTCQQMSQSTFEAKVLAHMAQLLLPAAERVSRQRATV